MNRFRCRNLNTDIIWGNLTKVIKRAGDRKVIFITSRKGGPSVGKVSEEELCDAFVLSAINNDSETAETLN